MCDPCYPVYPQPCVPYYYPQCPPPCPPPPCPPELKLPQLTQLLYSGYDTTGKVTLFKVMALTFGIPLRRLKLLSDVK